MNYNSSNINQSMDIQSLMKSFLKTLNPKEQREFLREFKTLTPEEQNEFYEALIAQASGQQGMQQGMQMQEGGQIDPMALFEQYLASLPEQTQDEIVMQLEALPQDQRMQIIMSLVESMNQPQMQKGGSAKYDTDMSDYFPVVEGKVPNIKEEITVYQGAREGVSNPNTTHPRGTHFSGRNILSVGSKGEEVDTLQKFLADKGFYKGKVDGIYGKKTKEAVANYQKWYNDTVKVTENPSWYYDKSGSMKPAENIKADGIVGDATRAALLWRPDVPKSPEGPELVTNRQFNVTDSYMPHSDPVDPTAALAMLGIVPLALAAPKLASFAVPASATVGRGLVKQAAKQVAEGAAKGASKQVIKQLPNTVPKGAPSSGGRFFQPRTPSSYGTRTSYQEGGQSQMVPIEVEGGETVKLPNGKLEKFTGPKHAEGGIPTQLPEGALIFSEHLKAPKEVVDLVMGKGKNRKKKYSYADLSKKYPTKPYERKLESPDYDQFEKQAASIKLQNNKAMLETIFAAQEMDKAMKGKPNDLQTAMSDTQMPMAKYGKLLKFQNAGKVDSKPSQWWLAPGLSHRFDQPVAFFSEENLREPAPSSWWTLKPSDFTESDFYTYKEYAQQRGSAYKEGFPGMYPQEQPEPPYVTDMWGKTIFDPEVIIPTEKLNERDNYQGPYNTEQQPSPAQPQNRPSSQRRSPLPTNLVEMWDPQNIDLISREYDVTLPNASLYDADTKSYRRSGTVGLDAPQLPNSGPSEYEVDATIPSLQRSRGKRVYGEQDWTSEPLMNDFKSRHAEFFEQNPNWDPTRPGDTKKFQEWYEEQNPGYFRDKGGFRGFDDKFGQYTWSAPSVKKRAPQAAPEPAARLPNRSAAIDSPQQPSPSREKPGEIPTKAPDWKNQPMQPAAPAAKKKNPLGISRQLSGSIFDFLMAASDNLDIDAPQFRDNRKNPLFTRYVDFEDEDVNKMYNQSMMQIMNSNMPEQVKQAQIANLNSKLQEFQGKEDFARYQNYQQKLGLDTEKLQKYMDTNIDQQSADIERYREKMGRINDLRNQFRAQKKARMVNPVRQFLDYVQKVDLQNQIYADQFKVNPYTGKVTFTEGKQQNALDQQATNMNQYGKVGEVSVLGPGVYIQNTKYGPILIQDGKATPITPIDMLSQGSKKSSRQTAAEILEGQ